MYIAAGQGQTTPGDIFWCQQKPLVAWVMCYKFQKISLKSDFIQYFHDFIHVYSPKAGADNPVGMKFLCQQEHLVTLVICCKFKKSLWSLILYIFSWFYTSILPWGRGRQPPGDKVLMSTEMSCYFIHLLQVSNKCLWSLILYNFFHDLIHVHSPGAGADSPQGTKVLCQQKCLVTSFISLAQVLEIEKYAFHKQFP